MIKEMLTIRVNTEDVRRSLDDTAKRQLPFALKNAITDTGLEFQQFQRKHDARTFTVRRPDWLEKTVKVTKFPTKANPAMTITIQPPGTDGKNRADIIAKFEDERSKESSKPGGHVAIPIRAKRNKRDIVVGKNRPRAFDFKRVGNAIRGSAGTFIVTTTKGAELILQRTKRGVFALYYLVRRVSITPDLHFEQNAHTVVDQVFEQKFSKRFDEAMRTAK